MKGNLISRTMPIHADAKRALRAYLADRYRRRKRNPTAVLFASRKGHNQPLGRGSVWEIINDAARACGIGGRIGTHSCRKTFAETMMAMFGRDIKKVQSALGHKKLDSTAQYIEVDEQEITEAVLTQTPY